MAAPVSTLAFTAWMCQAGNETYSAQPMRFGATDRTLDFRTFDLPVAVPTARLASQHLAVLGYTRASRARP